MSEANRGVRLVADVGGTNDFEALALALPRLGEDAASISAAGYCRASWTCCAAARSVHASRGKPPVEDYLRAVPTALIVHPGPALAGATVRLAQSLPDLEPA